MCGAVVIRELSGVDLFTIREGDEGRCHSSREDVYNFCNLSNDETPISDVIW